MPHMHLPLQSGSDSVLKRMARRCKTKDFKKLVNEARNQIDNFNVTTDIIVGFPGETNDEWIDSIEFIKQIGFSHIHIFTYSKRKGTKASMFDKQIDSLIKKDRSNQLHKLTQSMRREILNNEMGKEYSVLWESKDNKNNWSGYTDNYLKVQLKNNDSNLENKISRTKIVEISSDLKNCIVELV